MTEQFLGEVLDISDPKKLGRIKVRVRGWYDELDEDLIPWALPSYITRNRHDLPCVGSEVVVEFLKGSIYHPVWFTGGHYKNELDISDDDYESGVIILHKDLSKFDSEGTVTVRYFESDGLVLEVKKDSKVSRILFGTDNTVKMEADGRFIHLLKDMVSLGKENKSAEPAVLGTKNADLHDAMADLIQTVVSEITKFATQLAASASPSPYTAALAPTIASFIVSLQAAFAPNYGKIKTDVPSTKSEKTSLD